ncbi:hypothetical protein [Lentzea sp. NPDC051838]|uniref:hypothetical protein n=1 Tax=Lentzea sp. NPDC051838 TaxID=3154849 RepID=UPI003424035F
MGMFSFVKVRDLECPKCHHVDDYDVQFYFGGCDLDYFEVGEPLRWGAYDRGEAGHPLVVTDGFGQACTGCGGPYVLPDPPPEPCEVTSPDQFDIFIENDVIVHATWSTGEFPYYNDDVATPSRSASYIVLQERPPFLPPSQGSRSVAAKNDPSM